MNPLLKMIRSIFIVSAVCIFLTGCAGKTGEENETLDNLTVSDEENAYRVVELLLTERGEFMERVKQDIADRISSGSEASDTDGQTQLTDGSSGSGQFHSKEELLDELEGCYSSEMALAVCDKWLFGNIVGLYAETEDGMLLASSDVGVPLLFDNYFISIVSYSDDSIEAFVACEKENEDAENRMNIRGTYIEALELLRVERLEEGWRICGAQSGWVTTDYFDSDITGQMIPYTEEMSEEEASGIVRELYNLWADFYYRFCGELVTGSGNSPIEGYVDYDMFSSLEDILEQLGQILTQGCVDMFRELWFDRENPYYLEQDGVLYRMDATPIIVYHAADLIILREYTAEGICAYVIEEESGLDYCRNVLKITAINTEEGWRVGQLYTGYLSIDQAMPAYYYLQVYGSQNQ